MNDFFKTYDIRGLIDYEISLEVAEKIGKAFGTFVKGAPVVVGHDSRFSTKKMYQPFLDGLSSTGSEITAIGEYPSPVLMFNAWEQKKYGAILTASHNPAEYGGAKFTEPNGLSFVDQYPELKAIFEKGNFQKGRGTVKEMDGYAPYRDFLKSHLKFGRRIRVVVECLYATGGTIIPRLYEDLGLEVIALHADPKPDFNKERPEPKGENLKEMGRVIVETKADFGVGLDGDCDRSVILDDKGREMNGSVSSAIFIKHLLPKYPKGQRNVVMTVDCNSELVPLVKSLGGKLFWSEVGHGFIGMSIHKNKAVYGGEMSSHMWFDPFPFSDGPTCGLKMAELLSSSDKKLSKLHDEVNFAPMMKEYVDMETHERKEAVKDALVKRFTKEYPAAMKTRDGVKFFLNDIEWVLLRKSNNLPEFCIVIEAKTEKRLEKLHDEYRNIVNEAVNSL